MLEFLSLLLLPVAHRHAEVDEEDLSEFLNDGSWKRGYNIDRLANSATLSRCMHSLLCGSELNNRHSLQNENEISVFDLKLEQML